MFCWFSWFSQVEGGAEDRGEHSEPPAKRKRSKKKKKGGKTEEEEGLPTGFTILGDNTDAAKKKVSLRVLIWTYLKFLVTDWLICICCDTGIF